MDSSPSDLTLDYTPNGNGGGGGGGHPMTPKQAPPLVQEQHHLTAEQASATTIQKLQEFLSRLDDERLKIDAFKRELPLCMQLLNQAMEAYRQQLEACQMGSSHGGAAAAARAPLVLEEFIPLSKNIVGADAADQKTATENPKASWMVSAQLWNGPPPSSADAPATPKERAEHPPLDGGRGNGGAFLPFTKEMMATTDHSPAALLPELALAPGAEKDDAMVGINNGLSASGDKKPYLHHDAGGGGNIGNLGVARRDDGVQINGSSQTTTAAAEAGQAQAPQTNRKARRCWSPELHRRFVNALQILGGAQVATPKQIRELMKVDGLTNDEVKSHLQKYRLHTRRPMQAPTAPPAGAPQLVVLGGIWMPPDYAAQAAAAGPAALYGAHPATQAHYTAAVSSAAAQEYYHSAAAHHHHLQQHHHHPHPAMAHGRAVAAAPPAAAYKVHHPAAAASPESEGRGSGGGGRERSESIEEEGEGEDEEDDEDGLAADADADEIKY